MMDHICQQRRPVINVEVLQSPSSTASRGTLIHHVQRLVECLSPLYNDLTVTDFDDSVLENNIISISIGDLETVGHRLKGVPFSDVDVRYHVYQLQYGGPEIEGFVPDGANEELAAAHHWNLPSSDFHNLWDSLVFESEIKYQLLQFVTSTLLFADNKVDNNLISWNKVVLLHGPPGTGKTSLCKALAQKLSIRFNDRYKYAQLIEINSHSLFSKWFSESGKLVMKMFQSIQESISVTDALVILLIDEVESLTHARKSSMAGSDPSDAIRVVNALLTQIDQIRRYPNVLILTTSNVTGAIDLAFVDRADIKQYIGLPSAPAIYKIYTSCIAELMRAKIIYPSEALLSLRSLELARFVENDATRTSLQLREISVASVGMSGRTLRKLPLLAHALFIQAPSVTLSDFIQALLKAVSKQFEDQRHLSDNS